MTNEVEAEESESSKGGFIKKKKCLFVYLKSKGRGRSSDRESSIGRTVDLTTRSSQAAAWSWELHLSFPKRWLF